MHSCGLIEEKSISGIFPSSFNGIQAIKLKEDDELIDARICEAGDDILLASHQGKCNRFNEGEIRSVSRFRKG